MQENTRITHSGDAHMKNSREEFIKPIKRFKAKMNRTLSFSARVAANASEEFYELSFLANMKIFCSYFV
jgi:hypothetical protein